MNFLSYDFFDYKYNIEGYHGEDYHGPYRIVYLVSCLLISLILAVLLRKMKKENIKKSLKYIGLGMIVLYIIKSTWESYWDIKTGRGFNFFILPFDTCSILMWASLAAGFGKGKISEAGECWLITLGFTGGLANAIFIQGLKYYPFWTFGAFYSMFWHFVMVFLSWWLVISKYTKLSFKSILYAFALHIVFSIPVFVINGIKHTDFMLYETAGGIPLIEGLVKPLSDNHQYAIVTIIMVFVYLAIDAILAILYMGVQKLLSLKKNKENSTV